MRKIIYMFGYTFPITYCEKEEKENNARKLLLHKYLPRKYFMWKSRTHDISIFSDIAISPVVSPLYSSACLLRGGTRILTVIPRRCIVITATLSHVLPKHVEQLGVGILRYRIWHWYQSHVSTIALLTLRIAILILLIFEIENVRRWTLLWHVGKTNGIALSVFKGS